MYFFHLHFYVFSYLISYGLRRVGMFFVKSEFYFALFFYVSFYTRFPLAVSWFSYIIVHHDRNQKHSRVTTLLFQRFIAMFFSEPNSLRRTRAAQCEPHNRSR